MTSDRAPVRSCGWCFDRGGCVSPQACELPEGEPPRRSTLPTTPGGILALLGSVFIAAHLAAYAVAYL